MIEYSIYRLADGEFTGRRLMLTDVRQLERNTPPACGVVRGVYYPGRHRVDIESGSVVETDSAPAPADDGTRQKLRDRIAHLEAGCQRALRELTIDPHDVAARERLESVNCAIAEIRIQLQELG